MQIKWIQPLAIAALCAATLTSCGGNKINVAAGARDCANGYDPAVNVDANVPSFSLSKHLDQTAFKAFFKAIQPSSPQKDGSAPTTQEHNFADGVGALSHYFTDYKPQNDYQNYTSVHNAMDLINNEIGTNDIQNFNAGRQHIVYCIQQGTPAGYANGGPLNPHSVTLHDTSTGSDPNMPDNQDETWSYAVNWSYSPNPVGGQANVSRKLFGFNAISSSMISIYDPKTFNDVGFNQPQTTVYGFTKDNYSPNNYSGPKAQLTLNFTQQFVDKNADTWSMATEAKDTSLSESKQKNDTPTLPYAFDKDSNVRCVRMVVHYKSNSVDVYWSDTSPTSSGQGGSSTTTSTSGTGLGASYQNSCLSDSGSNVNHKTYTIDSQNYPNRAS